MFIINLSHDIHLVIDCNISPHTAVLHQVIVSIYWKELLALTWLGSEWCVTNLTYGRWILIQSIFGINRRANLSQPSVLVPIGCCVV